jgi:hypothetical protein
MLVRSQGLVTIFFLVFIVLGGGSYQAPVVRLVCPRRLLFCSIALDTSKQKKIVHMVRIPLAWLVVECGRFRECLGNNPSQPK